MATMWDMPLLPGEDTSGWSSLPPRQPPGPARGPAEDPFRVQAGFGAARNRKLSTDPNFSVLRRPQPEEGVDVQPEELGFARQVESQGSSWGGRPSSPVSAVLSDRATLTPSAFPPSAFPKDSRHGTPADGRQTRDSAIHSVGSSWGQENWAQDLDADLGDQAEMDLSAHLHAHSAEELGLGREDSRLSILGPQNGRRSRMSQVPACAPDGLHTGHVVDQQSFLDHERAPAIRESLYTEEQVGREKSKEELACYEGAAIKVRRGAKIREGGPSSRDSVRMGRRAKADKAGPRAKSAMAVLQTLEDELDPPLTDLAFPWVKERDPWLDGTSKLIHREVTDMDRSGSIAVLDEVLRADSATTKPQEAVVIHKASRYQRQQGSADVPMRNGNCEKSSSVPLTVEKLNNQDYVLTTAGVVSQTMSGHGEFMPMPEWLQESTYLKASKGRFNMSLWAVFNKFYHTCKTQKFQRMRKVIAGRCMLFRPTFKECLREVVEHCADEAAQPAAKLIQPKRHGRVAMGEFQKNMKEQRVLAHESFVEMMEKLSRLIECVISEVKVGEMRQRALDIEQAEKDEIYRWKKHGKDAAKLPGMPGSKQYGPNNRLHPKAPKISGLHAKLEEQSDSVLVPHFIRLCDFLTAYCVTYILDHHFSHFLNDLTKTLDKEAFNLEYFKTSVTFKAPKDVTAERRQAQVVKMVGQIMSGGDNSDELEPMADGSWTQVYFVPRANSLKDNLSTVLEDFVAIFDAPRLLFYEAFQEQVKSVVSFHEMNQVQGIQDIVPLNFVDNAVTTAHNAVSVSYQSAKKLSLEVFDGMDEFWLFANKKVRDFQASTTVHEVAHLPGTMRMLHQWRRKILDLAERKGGTAVPIGIMWVDGAPLEKELMDKLEELFREAQNAVERIIGAESMKYCAEMEKLTVKVMAARKSVMVCRAEMMPKDWRSPTNELDEGSPRYESPAAIEATRLKKESAVIAFVPSADDEMLPELEASERALFTLGENGWSMLGQVATNVETLDKMVLWLMKPIHWLPNQIAMKIDQPVSTKPKQVQDSWGSLAALKKGRTYTKEASHEEIDSGDDDTVYLVTVNTCDSPGAGTDANVCIEIWGTKGTLGGKHGTPMRLGPELLQEGDTTDNLFERGSADVFALPPMVKLGKLKEIVMSQDGDGFANSWMLESIQITDTRSEETWTFPCNGWMDAGRPNKLMVLDDGGGNKRGKLKRTNSSKAHTTAGLSKLKGMIGPAGGAAATKPGVRSLKSKVRAKTWTGPKITRRRMGELEKLLGEAADLQRRGNTPASSSDAGSHMGGVELDMLGNPMYDTDVEVATATVSINQ